MHVVPEEVEVSGQSGRLRLELLEEPAARREGPEPKRCVGQRHQLGFHGRGARDERDQHMRVTFVPRRPVIRFYLQ